ncbi:MAG: hypothetical protein KF868_21720 [Acidobacteria bacterium]|nr:hypothetical protein [Acidobacteriota bacterium]MCW5969507.1 hypothetical protein [Blastocatellales bacterium]
MKSRAWAGGGVIVIAGLMATGLGGCRNRTESVNARTNSTETASAAPSPDAAMVKTVSRPDDEYDYPLRVEKHERYKLAPGARVEVQRFWGLIEIEPVEGDEADFYLVRSAREEKVFREHRVEVEHKADYLNLRMERERRSVMFQIFSDHGGERQRLVLRLPRLVNLSLDGVGGKVRVGEFEGSLKLDGINGRIEAARASEFTEIDGANGNVRLLVNDLKGRGVKVGGVNGRIDVQCGPALNADVEVDGVNGRVITDVSSFAGERRRGGVEGKIGKGGSRIEISGVNGPVRFAPIEAASPANNADSKPASNQAGTGSSARVVVKKTNADEARDAKRAARSASVK